MTDNKLEIVLAAKDITGNTFDKVQSSITGFGKSIVSVNGMIAGFAGATGLGMIVKSSLDTIAELDRLSTMAGVTAESFQELSFAAGQYQISQDALTDGMKELSLRGADFVRDGAGPAKGAFEALGYSADDLNAMLKDTPSLLVDIISRLEGLDKASQIKFADELFGGTGGEQFVAMIQGGADALDTMRQSAHDLGVVIDEDMVKQSVEAKKQVEQLTTVLSAQFTSVVAELGPDISNVAKSMSEWTKTNKEFINEDLPKYLNNIATSAKAVMGTLVGIGKNLAINSQALALTQEGYISWTDFLTSSTNELERLIEQFDAQYFGVQSVTRAINEQTEGYEDYIKNGVVPVIDKNTQLIASNSKVAESIGAVAYEYQRFYDELNLTDKERRMQVDPDEVAKVKKILEDQADLKEKLYKEELDQQKDLAESQQDAYEEIYGTVKGFTRDVIDDFDGMGDTLKDLAKSIAKDIAATFLTTNVVMPITLAAGSSLGLTAASGTPYSDLAGGNSSFSGSSILSGANSLYGAFSGATSTMAFDATLGAGEFALGALGYDTATASAMASGWAGTAATVAPYLGIAAMALPLITSLFEDEPEPRIGIRKGDLSEYGFNAHTQDVGGESDIKSYITDYYEGYFAAIDEVTANSVADVLNDTDWERLRVHPEDYDSIEEAVFALNDTVFKKFSDGFLSGLAGGQLDGYLDESFVTGMRADNESLLDTFVRLGTVIDETDGFVDQFKRQVDEFGETTIEAYQNTLALTSTLDQIESGMSSIVTTSSVNTLDSLTDSWQALIKSMEDVNASVDDLSLASSGRSQVLGSNITGLSADSIQSALVAGNDIDSILQSAIQGAGYAEIAEIIAEEYITTLNEEIGNVWLSSDGDLQTVLSALQDIDTTEAQAEISRLQEAFGLITTDDTATEIEDVADGLDDTANILSDLLSGVENARGDYETWIGNALSEAESAYDSLVSNFEDAEAQLADVRAANIEKQTELLQEQLQTQADAYSDSISDLTDELSDLESIAESLSEYRQSLLLSDDSPLLPGEMLAEAKGQFEAATPENLVEASQNLLSAGRGALTDYGAYQELFASVQSRMSGAESTVKTQSEALQEQIDMETAQVELLNAEIELMSDTSDTLMSIEDAEAEYYQAKMELDNSKLASDIDYYEKELDRLDEINGSVVSLDQATRNYQSALVSAISQGYSNLEYNFQSELNDLKDNLGVGASFAGGGIISGPTSGYKVLTEFHGTEMIIPQSKISNIGGNIDDDLKSLIKELISQVSAGNNLNKKVHRILDRVDAGQGSLLVRTE